MIRLYTVMIGLASVFHSKAKKLVSGRRQLTYSRLAPLSSPIWFHASSVGEFEQALPLYRRLKLAYPQQAFVFSFYSPSGYEYAEKKYPELNTFYLPVDTRKHMRELITDIRPRLVIIIKYEFWFHLLNELKKMKVPVFLVSGIFRQSQPFFHPLYGGFFKRMLSCFEHIFVQNEESITLLKKININQVTLTGDTRLDQVTELKLQAFNDDKLQTFVKNQPVFIAGSVWASDLPVLKTILRELPAHYKVIIAPHEIDHFDTGWITEPYCFYTQSDTPMARIMVLDTVGMLSKVYRLGRIAYVGGGFGKGIHNILEPSVYELPVLIGPHYQKFNEAHELLALGSVFSVADNPALVDLCRQLTLNDDLVTEIKEKLRVYFNQRANISEKIHVFLKEYMNPYLVSKQT